MKNISSVLVLSSLCLAVSGAESDSVKSKIGAVIREDAKEGKLTVVELPKKKSEEKAEAEAKKAADKPKDEKVVAMPQVRVEGRFPRETETTYEAKKLVDKYDKQIEREKEKTSPTEVDKTLNNNKISYLGERSAAASADNAKANVREMEMKQSIAAMAVDPATEAENKKLMEMLQELEYKKNRKD